MDISDVINSSGASRHSKDYHALLKKLNRYIFKLNRHIFKYGWLYFLFFYLLYFALAAYFYTNLYDIYQAYAYKTAVHNVKATTPPFMYLFVQHFGKLFIGQIPPNRLIPTSQSCLTPPNCPIRLITGSQEIGFITLGAVFLLWFFRIWQVNVPKTLRDLIKNNRISAARGDTANRYLHFLDDYRHAFSGPTNYLLFIIIAILWAYTIYYVVSLFNIAHHQAIFPHISPDTTDSLFLNLLPLMSFAMIKLMLIYPFCTILSVIFISGRYLRKLLQDFKIMSDPTHLDRCGGLKQLGNFCLWLILPVLAVSVFFLAYDFTIYQDISNPGRVGSSIASLNVLNSMVILALCVIAFCIVIWAGVIPLWKIHTKMIEENEIAQQKQSTEINRLEKQLQASIDKDQLEEAKVFGEKLALEKTLNTSYPKWPFITLKAATISAFVLSVAGALPDLIRLLTALIA